MTSTTKEAGKAPKRRLKLRKASEIKTRQIEWLWPGRIPLGKLVVFQGDAGLGKSLVTVDMAARISTGAPWPDATSEPQPAGDAIIVSAEDDADDTICPRLEAAGADLDHVAVLAPDNDGPFFTVADGGACARELLDAVPNARLLILDPVSAFMGDINTNRDSAVRGALAPLASLAAARSVTVVLLMHHTKEIGRAHV